MGAWQVLDPGNTLKRRGAQYLSTAVMPTCPASPQNLPALAGSLSGFTVTVTCGQTANTTEGNRNVRVFQIVATACNQGRKLPRRHAHQRLTSSARCKRRLPNARSHSAWPRCGRAVEAPQNFVRGLTLTARIDRASAGSEMHLASDACTWRST